MVPPEQKPECLPPLGADPGSGGKPSDHLIVVMEPISTIDNKPARLTREIILRPMKQSVIDKFEINHGMKISRQKM